MTRWLLVGSVIVLTALALVGVRRFEPDQTVLDELAAYEVTTHRGVTVRVPGGLREVLITSWAAVAPHADHTPRSRYPYALDVTAVSTDGVRLVTHRFEIASRISGDPRQPRELGEYAARLANGSAWLTDPRTVRFDVSVLAGHSGRVEARLAPQGQSTALVRLAFENERGTLERKIVERRLSPQARHRLLARTSSLGFPDLPAEVRGVALSHWGRRLIARGREGIDYVVRQLLVGDYRDSGALEPSAPPTAPVGPERWVALNLIAPALVRVHGLAGTTIHVAQDQGGWSDLLIGAQGTVDQPFDARVPHTLTYSADRPSEIRFSVKASEQHAQIGGLERPDAEGGRVWLLPDVTRQRYLRLDPTIPLRVRVARGQRAFGVTLRALVDERADRATADLSVAYVGHERRSLAPYVVDLAASQYEVAEGARVSESRSVLVSPPPEVQDVELTGSRNTLVALWTEEPSVSRDVLMPAYDVPLEPEQVWRYAPKAERAFAAIRPTNDEQLEEDGRRLLVSVQPRIEALEEGRGERIAERVLEPVGTPLARHLLRPAWCGATAPVPENAWMRLTPANTGTQPQQVRAAQTTTQLVYRVPGEALGRTLAVLLDGRVIVEHQVLSTMGQVTFGMPPGPHEVALGGIGLTQEAWLTAAPAAGGSIYKKQRVFALADQHDLSFRFERRPGELLALLISVASEAASRNFEVRYEIDPGRVPPAGGRLYRRLTQTRGALVGRTGTAGQGMLWEAPRDDPSPELPHGVATLRLSVGDDLEPGRHLVRLSLKSDNGTPLWVRALVAGRRDASDWGTDE